MVSNWAREIDIECRALDKTRYWKRLDRRQLASQLEDPIQMIMMREQRPQQEMLEKPRESFLGLKSNASSRNSNAQRPTSVHTEFMETDWEMEEEDDDEVVSEFEEEGVYSGENSGENSPRVSLNSSGQPSMTTLSSYDEVQTPRSTRIPQGFNFEFEAKPVEGPRGPHLFRSSISISNSVEFQNALSLSPVTPRITKSSRERELEALHTVALTPLPPTGRKKRQSGPFRFTDEELDTKTLAAWSPEMIAQWMLNAGLELSVAERFVENDINGPIVVTLKFEDLKELGIISFGVRTRVWEEIHAMRNLRPTTPDPETPIEDEPSREVRRELRKNSQDEAVEEDPNGAGVPRRRPSRNQHTKVRPKINDIISPLESVSIVGIEQMMPKPHHCSKGENCSKWKKNQRMIEAFKKEHPFVDINKGGIIMVAGDPGNPDTAEAMKPATDDKLRPVSDAVPSVVASSDVMGPGAMSTLQYLQEATLRSIQARDPQDNVRQFLDFQQQHGASSEVPPTPPFEILPREVQQAVLQGRKSSPHQGLRALPKLAIPSQLGPGVSRRQPASAHHITSFRADSSPEPDEDENEEDEVHTQAHTQAHTQTHTQRLQVPEAEDDDDATPTGPLYRFGTPFSDMDVPLTAVPLGPVARDASQSVPPDMNYRPPLMRSASRAQSRRPSFPVLPSLDENRIVSPVQRENKASAYSSFGQRVSQQQRPVMHAPPRGTYPWTKTERPTLEKAIAPVPGSSLGPNKAAAASASSLSSMDSCSSGSGSNSSVDTPLSSVSSNSPGKHTSRGVIHHMHLSKHHSPVGSNRQHSASAGAPPSATGAPLSYAGLMRKRKTKMLRHEWAEHYFQLRGTRLTMHNKDAATARASANNNNRTLEYIDIDDYAIACSAMASSKLNAAFRAMHLRKGSDEKAKEDVAAFSFQLIPQDQKGGVRLRKGGIRESSIGAVQGAETDAPAPPPPEGAVNGTGKTHYFAVKSRDDRIDWMRELMLAKAKKQKGEGFEVSVNGNMI